MLAGMMLEAQQLVRRQEALKMAQKRKERAAAEAQQACHSAPLHHCTSASLRHCTSCPLYPSAPLPFLPPLPPRYLYPSIPLHPTCISHLPPASPHHRAAAPVQVKYLTLTLTRAG